MKIRHRLALIFTSTVAGVLILLSLVIFFFSRNFHLSDFYKRVENRVDLTVKFFLEEPLLPPEVAQQVRNDFLQKLPFETEWILDPGDPLPPGFPSSLKKELDELPVGENLRFMDGKRQGIARIYDLNGEKHLIIVTALDRFGISKLANLQRIILLALPLALIFAAIIGWWATKRALTPLEVNIDQARRITTRNLGARLALPSQRDEIHAFAQIFNDLLERIENAFTFQQAFINNASHEIRNPLTVIAGEAEIALSADRSRQDYRGSLEVISQEADRLNLLVNNLLSLARTGGEGPLPDRQELPVGRLLRDVRKTVQAAWPKQPFHWPRLSNAQLQRPISCNLLLMRSALINVIDNACKYGEGKPVTIQVSFPEEGGVRIQVQDQGIGIPAQDLPLVLVPLFRASNARSYAGQGIGLPLVDRIIRQHEGHLDIDSAPGQGTRVSLYFG